MTKALVWNRYQKKVCLESYKIKVVIKGESDGKGMSTVLKFVEYSPRLG